MQFEKRLANFGIFSATLVCLTCLGVIVIGRLFPGELRAMPGSQAPEISLRDFDNQDLSLSALRGGFVLVYFAPDLTEPGDSTKNLHAATAAPSEPRGGSVSQNESVQNRSRDLARLTEFSRVLSAQEVTVVESRHLIDAGAMTLLSLVSQADPENHHASHTLLDIDGDIARRFKVDAVAVQPTLFVIDARGVIRYRGSCETASADDAIRRLALASNRQVSLDTASAANTSAIGHLSALGTIEHVGF